MWEWLGNAYDWAADGISDWFGGSGNNTSSGSSSGSSSSGGLGDTWLGRNWDTIGKAVDSGRKIYNLFDANDARQDTRGALGDIYRQIEADQAAYNAQQAAGAAASRRARLKAQKKALEIQKKYLTEMAKQYQPYADAVAQLTPAMTKNYQQYLDSTALLNQYLTPAVSKTLTSDPKPIAMPQVNPEAYLASSKAQDISFPSLEEVLKKRG